MKNMKIGRKLALSFGIFAIIILFVTIVGGMTAVNMNHRMTDILALVQTGDLDQSIQAQLDLISIDADSAATRTLTIIVSSTVVALIAIIILVKYLSGIISKPLVMLDGLLEGTGKFRDLVWKPQDLTNVATYKTRRDEIGSLFASYEALVNNFIEICNVLEEVANGNLDVEVKELGNCDLIAQAVKKMEGDLNEMFHEINNASGQVSSGSKHIADGAQTLAQGSTEQAATVQQLSSSANEIAAKTRTNAQMAGKAAELAETIKSNAIKGSKQMDDMVGAVDEISQASQNISKVIKSIDDIAFQTNILALNAAVEAARAGQHGKGFAVVAEEVRNLAAKSAEAAKDTGLLISNSMEKSEYGAQIAKDTAESLAEIVTGINRSSNIISEIAMASEAQTTGIEQINTGIDQVANVVQQNSASAQQSAAAAEELSGQSATLESLIAQFKLKSHHRELVAGSSETLLALE